MPNMTYIRIDLFTHRNRGLNKINRQFDSPFNWVAFGNRCGNRRRKSTTRAMIVGCVDNWMRITMNIQAIVIQIQGLFGIEPSAALDYDMLRAKQGDLFAACSICFSEVSSPISDKMPASRKFGVVTNAIGSSFSRKACTCSFLIKSCVPLPPMTGSTISGIFLGSDH